MKTTETKEPYKHQTQPLMGGQPLGYDGVSEAVRAPLTFEALRKANLQRCPEAFHEVDDWTPTDWATAMAGECGEACNLIKKMRRGEDVPKEKVAKELADMVTYADLLAARLRIDLGEAVRAKFNEVSDRLQPLSTVHL